MRGGCVAVAALVLWGCANGGGGGGKAHAPGFQGDVDACYRTAERAHAALAGGDRQGAVSALDALLARLDAARAHAWLGERREWLRVEERVVLLEQAIATARPEAAARSRSLVAALDRLRHGQSLAGQNRARGAALGPGARPGLGDAAAIARHARDLLATGDAAGALPEIQALRRRLREARGYASKPQRAGLDALAERARRLEDLTAALDPRARVQAGLLAAELGGEPVPPAASTGPALALN